MADLSIPHDPLNPATFVPPNPLPTPSVTIEFCDRCRWLHRATWVSTELLLTFPPPVIKVISVLPLNVEETAGRFRVWLTLGAEPPELVWDRKVEGGFPELKELVIISASPLLPVRFSPLTQMFAPVSKETTYPGSCRTWKVAGTFGQDVGDSSFVIFRVYGVSGCCWNRRF